jgi:pimeloyl-ACP methyl ester carboxylesterase
MAALLADGGHLVGHSYCGVSALLAAAQRPDAMRSLTLVEPGAFAVARGDPAVEALIARRAARLTPDEYLRQLRRAQRGMGPDEPFTPPEEDRAIQAEQAGWQGVEAPMRVRPPWEAEIPLNQLAQTRFPKLMVSGNWSRPFDAVCDTVARAMHANRAVFAGASHVVQKIGQPFNDRLAALWAVAGGV